MKQVAIDVFELWSRFLQNSFGKTLLDNVHTNLTNWRTHLVPSPLSKETQHLMILKDPLKKQQSKQSQQLLNQNKQQETIQIAAQPGDSLQPPHETKCEPKQVQFSNPLHNGHAQHSSNCQQMEQQQQNQQPRRQTTKQGALAGSEKKRHVRRGSVPSVPPLSDSRHALPLISACHRVLKKLSFAVGGGKPYEDTNASSVVSAARRIKRSFTPTLKLADSEDFKHEYENEAESRLESSIEQTDGKEEDLLRLSDSSEDTNCSEDSNNLMAGAELRFFATRQRLEQRRASCPVPVLFLT